MLFALNDLYLLFYPSMKEMNLIRQFLLSPTSRKIQIGFVHHKMKFRQLIKWQSKFLLMQLKLSSG